MPYTIKEETEAETIPGPLTLLLPDPSQPKEENSDTSPAFSVPADEEFMDCMEEPHEEATAKTEADAWTHRKKNKMTSDSVPQKKGAALERTTAGYKNRKLPVVLFWGRGDVTTETILFV